MCESFFATLECELLDRSRFETQAEAKMAIFGFIEGWYNPHRRHSSIGYLSPVNCERRICPALNPQPQDRRMPAGGGLGITVRLLH
jgi:putative transposase